MATTLVTWLVSENTGTTINDTAPGTAVNGTATLGTGGAWSSIASGKGITFGTGNAGIVTGSLASTKVATAFSGLKTASIEVRCDLASTGSTETMIYFGDNTGGAAGIMMQNDFGVVTLYACSTYVNSVDVGTGLHTYHEVVDTTQATAANRVLLYKDASTVSLAGSSYPAQNTAIDVGITNYANNRLSLGCEGAVSINQVASGKIYYGAWYASALSSGTISANHTALASNNDADPNGGASTATGGASVVLPSRHPDQRVRMAALASAQLLRGVNPAVVAAVAADDSPLFFGMGV